MINILISLPMAAAPALLLVWYYYRQDREKPEPKGLVIKIFLLGIVSIVPAMLLEMLVQFLGSTLDNFPVLVNLFRAFIVAGLCEELVKLLVVKQFVYNKIEFDEVMDGIVYTIVASLGFACFENVLFVINGGLPVAIMRSFTAVPMHALASGMMGFYIGKAKFAGTKKEEISFMMRGLIIAVLIHGLYDFVLFIEPFLASVFSEEIGVFVSLTIFPLMIFVFFILKGKIKSAITEDIREGRTE
ncbi:MAG: PrsW family intramembrane metalloprotease [bacterium]|nr:PrsW family intramembrane metalloprotease [bacterium]